MKDIKILIAELQQIQEELETNMKYGLSEKLQNIVDDLTKSFPVDKPVKPEIAVNHIKNWKVYHSNSSDTGIVLNHPQVGDESVCIQNIETGEFKYLTLNR